MISDWTEFGLVRPSVISFDFNCHVLCNIFRRCSGPELGPSEQAVL